MTYPNAFTVDAAQLSAAAGAVQQAADVTRHAYDSRRDDLSMATTANHGWASAAVARNAAANWEVFLHRLAGSISELATGVRAAADRYQEADRQADLEIRASGRYAS